MSSSPASFTVRVEEVRRPEPRPDRISEAFWTAAAQGRLVIQRCARCRTFQHPPRPLCRACGSSEVSFEPVSGEGRLWSWTTTHHKVVKGLEAATPYVCMVVQLVEQDDLFVVSDLIGRRAEGLAVGAGMRVIFPQCLEGGRVLPQFVLAEAEGRKS